MKYIYLKRYYSFCFWPRNDWFKHLRVGLHCDWKGHFLFRITRILFCWICTCQYLIYFGKLSSQREKFYINFRPFHHDDLGPWFHSPICSVWRTCMSVNKPFVDVVYSMSKSLHFQNNSHLGFQLFEVQLKQTSYIVWCKLFLETELK